MNQVAGSRIDASDVLPLFPTLVWKIQLSDGVVDAIESAALPALREMRRKLGPLAPGQGWQSQQTLHELEALQELVTSVETPPVSAAISPDFLRSN